MHRLLLASSSPYRRELLSRLSMPFDSCAPQIDETAQPGETPEHLVRRLSEEKARALASAYPDHLIIGSDQVAMLGHEVLGKPHTHERAIAQLRACSGASVTFLTGLALLNSRNGNLQVSCVPFIVHFRELGDSQIERYLRTEQPYDCAGSFKAESLGISLFRTTEGEDATSLVGLPLIRLVDMLLNEGAQIP